MDYQDYNTTISSGGNHQDDLVIVGQRINLTPINALQSHNRYFNFIIQAKPRRVKLIQNELRVLVRRDRIREHSLLDLTRQGEWQQWHLRVRLLLRN